MYYVQLLFIYIYCNFFLHLGCILGLYKLFITNNPLVVIPDDAFLGLERTLWKLDLNHNELLDVPSKALRYLQKLRYLDLTGLFK